MLGARVWGQSGASVKDQASHDLASEYGHKGPVLRPRCVGVEGAETQLLFYSTLLLFYGNNG